MHHGLVMRAQVGIHCHPAQGGIRAPSFARKREIRVNPTWTPAFAEVTNLKCTQLPASQLDSLSVIPAQVLASGTPLSVIFGSGHPARETPPDPRVRPE